MTQISEFSSHYYVIDADVIPYVGDDVVASHELYNGLRWYVDEPLLHVGNSHHWLECESAVPSDTIAIPKSVEHPDEAPVLVAKDEHALPDDRTM